MIRREMRLEVGGERLDLEWHEDEGMFRLVLGPVKGRKCTVGTHCDRAVAVLMFNWEAKAMQRKWTEET